MAEKVSKQSVDYRPASVVSRDTGELRRCGNCSMFRAPSRCTLVRGVILRDAVCDKWEAKR